MAFDDWSFNIKSFTPLHNTVSQAMESIENLRATDSRPEWEALKSIVLIGNYLPRQCGIATFTTHLLESIVLNAQDKACWAIAMNDRPEGYAYPSQVRFEINQSQLNEYSLAADLCNLNQVDVICLQHEYGIFGGKRGSFIIELLRNLKIPVVTTLHTILKDPNLQDRHIMMQLAELSDRLVVMSERSVEFLRDIYQVPEEKIVLIHHGIPDVPFVESDAYKDKFGVAGKQIILTFGLLSPGKGIEVVIDALPEIVKAHPQVIYMVVGATHPHLKAEQGEDYRNSLYLRARELGVSDHIVFHDRFVADEDLLEFIGAADIYVTPYQNEAQIISGTLAYALGMGKAVVSTPYWHAQELLADGRGRLVPFRDPVALAREVIDLLDHPDECRAIQERAYQYGRKMVWSNVGRRYLDTFAAAKRQRLRKDVPERQLETLGLRQQQLPEIKLDYLRRMTDDTGMLQHAKYTVADRTHGYCVDDNARALIVAVTLQDLQPLDSALGGLAAIYLGFLGMPSMVRPAASAISCPMIATGSRKRARRIPTVVQCGDWALRWRWVGTGGRWVLRTTCSIVRWLPSKFSLTRGPSPSPSLVSMPTCPATAGTAADAGCARYFRTGSCSSSWTLPPRTGPGVVTF